MTGTLLDGKALAKQIEAELAIRVENLKRRNGNRTPILATILVGDNPASVTYVRMKGNACSRVGIESLKIILPAESNTETVVEEIKKLNDNPDVYGILLQHPVPGHIDERFCFDHISLEKDVDGVTSQGFGRIAMNEPAYQSATAVGILKLMEHYGLSVEGKHAVIVGRSPIIGKPLAMMLLSKNATVTICHSKTEGLPEIVKLGDIVVGALGKPKYIRGEWIKDGAIVIDAGYNKGNIGDIELSTVIERCTAYTPVPGGVGPMGVVTLMTQTVEAAEKGT